MRRDDQEADYLVPTQLEADPESFEAVVEEAFRLEYGVKQRQEFAEVMGVDKSRITQIFQNPENLQPESIRNLLSFFKLPKNRTRILKAWNKRAFGDSLGKAKQGRMTAGRLDELAMKTLHRMVRQARMERAAQLAYELSRKGVTLELRENALDLLCWCHQRLDQPGQAMAAARRIIEGARSRSEPRREARGHLFRARILISLADSTPKEFDPALVEKAFASGEMKNLNALEMSAVLTSRVHAETESPEVAIRYLTQTTKRCRDFEDRYHQRLVEWQLARLHSSEL